MVFNIEKKYTGSLGRTYTYLLPLLGSSHLEFKNVENCFLGDRNFEDEQNKLFLLTRISSEPWFNSYFKEITSHPKFDRYYKVQNSYFMFVFKIEGEDLEEYTKFKEGKYSTFNQLYKRKILNFYNLQLHSDVAKVLFRAEDKYKEWEERVGQEIPRSQEIGSMPDAKIEVFDEKSMIEVVNNE